MPARALAALLALLGAALAPGCLGGGPLDLSCGQRILPADVPRDAPQSGGRGDATLNVRVLDASNSSLARAAVLAWWPANAGRIHVVALRTNGDGVATVHAPAGAAIRFAGGESEWSHEGSAVAGQPVPPIYPGAATDTLQMLPHVLGGFVGGNWTQVPPVGLVPLGMGPTRAWHPKDMAWADPDHLARLQSLDLRLAWRNNQDGVVDLAIAVGRGDTWTQWNQAVQATEGTQQEDLTLERGVLEAGGWTTGEGLRVGPALGEYGVTTDKVTWDLRWTAHFDLDTTLGDVCAGVAGVEPMDVTSG